MFQRYYSANIWMHREIEIERENDIECNGHTQNGNITHSDQKDTVKTKTNHNSTKIDTKKGLVLYIKIVSSVIPVDPIVTFVLRYGNCTSQLFRKVIKDFTSS